MSISTFDRPRVAIMTSGGDCAGLNAAIKAVVDRADELNWDVIGIEEGTLGLLENRHKLLCPADVADWESQPSTNLYSTREKYRGRDVSSEMAKNFQALNCRALIVIGGDGSLSEAWKLSKKENIPLVAIPKTIDLDIGLTDHSIGYDTAVSKVVETMRDLEGTAKAHRRIMVVETMGRDRGWICVGAAVRGNADAAMIPEFSYDIGSVANHLAERTRKNRYAMLLVSEGVMTPEGKRIENAHVEEQSLGGIGHIVARHIEKLTNIRTCTHVVGYVQRGGRPTRRDCLLATNMGVYGMELVAQGESGVMVSVQGNAIYSRDAYRSVKIEDALAHKHIISPEHPLVQEAQAKGVFMNTEMQGAKEEKVFQAV